MDTKPPTFEEALRDAMPIADTTAVREAHARDVEKARLEELKALEDEAKALADFTMTPEEETLVALVKRAESAEARVKALVEVLNNLMDRMDRARSLLTDGKPTWDRNWGILDTTLDRAALAERKP